MKQMQTIIKEYPSEARTILIQNPQLTYAMLQSLVIMGLIPVNDAVNILHKRSDVPSINNSSSVATNLVSNFQSTPSLVPQPLPFHSYLTSSMNFPLATTTSIQPLQTGGSPLSRPDQEKAQLLMQVLQLNDAQIAQLPVDQRASIILLREQMQQSGMVAL
jgi:cleavage stimulation factor subunit 2